MADLTQTTAEAPSPYDECAGYRSQVQSQYDEMFPRVDQIRNERWSEYPSPNGDGVSMSMEEALALGAYLHAMAWAQAIRETMESIAALVPPPPIQDRHSELVEALYAWRGIEIDYAVVLYPPILYGEPTDLGSSESEQKKIAAQLDPVFLAVEEALELAILLCPDS